MATFKAAVKNKEIGYRFTANNDQNVWRMVIPTNAWIIVSCPRMCSMLNGKIKPGQMVQAGTIGGYGNVQSPTTLLRLLTNMSHDQSWV
ncbi:MAG: hypothetical protein GY706_14300, partial [Bacteroides sp.]|nr:hypothetical protein [Bacteroides sp.]